MGVNIIPYYIGDKIEEDGFHRTITAYKATEHPEFDSMRHSGDREFVYSEDLDWITLIDDPKDPASYIYQRPSDLTKATNWVKDNIDENNQSRLIDLFEEMRENVNLYIYVSY